MGRQTKNAEIHVASPTPRKTLTLKSTTGAICKATTLYIRNSIEVRARRSMLRHTPSTKPMRIVSEQVELRHVPPM